jgi:hypothetical protein
MPADGGSPARRLRARQTSGRSDKRTRFRRPVRRPDAPCGRTGRTGTSPAFRTDCSRRTDPVRARTATDARNRCRRTRCVRAAPRPARRCDGRRSTSACAPPAQLRQRHAGTARRIACSDALPRQTRRYRPRDPIPGKASAETSASPCQRMCKRQVEWLIGAERLLPYSLHRHPCRTTRRGRTR